MAIRRPTPQVTMEIDLPTMVDPPTDTTLSIAGMAADAKATGDAIAAIDIYINGQVASTSETEEIILAYT